MEEFAREALDAAHHLGPAYIDVRVIQARIDAVQTRDGALQTAGEQEDSGFGIRALVDGAWGFAAHSRLEREQIPGVARAAVEAARAASRVNPRPVELASNPAVTAQYRTLLQRDPFGVSLEEKQDLLLAAEPELRRHTAVQASRTSLLSFYQDKIFTGRERPLRPGLRTGNQLSLGAVG